MKRSTLDGPIDRLALAVALQELERRNWNAATVDVITPHPDGSVTLEGYEYHTGIGPTLYILTASANGYVRMER